MHPRRRLAALLVLAVVSVFPACGSPQDAAPTPATAPTRGPAPDSTFVTTREITQTLTPIPGPATTATPGTIALTATTGAIRAAFATTYSVTMAAEAATKGAIATQVAMLPRADTLPPCHATDLIARWEGAQGATGGMWLGGIAFANTSARPCVLEGTPTLLYFDAAHMPLMFTVIPCQSPSQWHCAVQPIVLIPTSGLPPHHFPSYVPGAEAAMGVYWQRYRPEQPPYCGPPMQMKPAEIWVRLPNNGGDVPLQDIYWLNGFAGEVGCDDTIYVHPVEGVSR